MEEINDRLAGLSPEKRRLLETLLRQKKVAAAAASAIPRRDQMPADQAAGPFPLSFAQERLWLTWQLAPTSAAYNIPVPIEFAGPLDVAALRESLAHLVRRHESLRTRFEERDGVPVQVIDPPGAFSLPLADLTALPEEARSAEAGRLTQEEIGRPFDLLRGPVFRSLLLRLSATRHVLLSNMHHIVSDGWSTGVFGRETTLLYEAISSGRPAATALPPLPIQYADFAVWQRRALEGVGLEKQLAYWRERLAGLDPVLELPTDRPRPARRTDRGGNRLATLLPAVAQRLQELSSREQTTLFSTLLAGFSAFLHRQTGREDLCVGTPVAGRRKVETEGLIGFFVNTLVVRSTQSGDAPFREHLKRLHEAVVDAQDNQDLPFDRLLQELAPARSPSHTPIFQVLFSLQSAPSRDIELPAGLSVRPVPGSTRTTKFDLTLGVTEGGGEIWLNLEHSIDLFDESTAARMLGQLEALLAGAAAAPETALPALPLLSPSERHQILEEWGTGSVEPPSGACLHELFAAQVARTPEAVALVHGAERSTYAELADRAGSLARWLQAAGVGPETRVAVCLERSPDLIASLLGILAAGGAYVPIDPAYPMERRALMLEDSGAAVLITRGPLSADLPATGARTLDLDLDLDLNRDRDREAVFARTGGGFPSPSGVTPGNLAYLIYTSGSTGRPKAVAIEHRSAVALALWARELFPPEELDGVLAATSVCFDLSVFEIFVPLAWGGRLILAENALALPSLPARDEVRLLNTVPSAAAELVRGGNVPASVRTVNLAGEPLPGALAAALQATGTVERVLNLYGPSEDTTYSTGSLVPRGGERPPAIGRPLPGTRAFVVDRSGGPVPAGVAGELWLAGAGLARGYLGRPELTAEKFTPDPFSDPSGFGGERVYRTGDLVRFRPDGELEFLGRIDHQVKVRGFRIELGEIEEALRSHPAVEDCVCMVRDAALVAYLAGAPDLTELREHLGRRLPVYMVPSTFVVLPALPRTPNGKIDRKALPAPERRLSASELVAPRTRTEEILAEVWKELLGLDQAGVEDSFFALGGHSLLGTQALARVRQAFGVDLPLRELFENPTVAALATLIDRRIGQGGGGAALEQPIPPREPQPGEQLSFPLSFAQERLWLTWQLSPESAAYNIPAAFRFTGALDVAALGRSLSHVVARHESLRTRFEERDGVPVQVIDPPGGFSLPLADLTGLPAEAREAEGERLTLEEIRRPFDLQRGPVFRALLVRLGAAEHFLISCMHHIVSDGWSTGVFGRETTLLYAALAAGRPADRVLPPLPIQYADFALWQRRTLAGAALEEQLGYWRRQLAGLDPVLELPADRPRPARRTDRGDERALSLPPAVIQGFQELSSRGRITHFAALLAAVCAFLHRQTGVEDLCVGTPVAGRRKVETEGLIGFFVNTLVVRSTLVGDPTFREHAARIHETFLDAQGHQDLPFDRLVLELEPERDPSHTPLFQVLFNLLNAPARTQESQELPAGLEIRPVEGSTRTAKFDLTFGITEGGDELWLNLAHSADLFDDSTAARLLGQLAAFFAEAAASPESPLSEIPLLSPSELHQILTVWGSGGDVAPARACLHELFAAQVERTPEAVALVHGEERLTYAELAGRAGGLARWLRQAGVGPETRVAVCLERSPDLIASLLGILAAGGAYVPIDPAYPAERQVLMLEDSGAAVLITRGSLAAGLPATGARVLDLDAGQIPASGGLPAVQVLPGHLAYLIYTSGSTGRPKAVAIEHRSAVALALWARELFPPEELDGVLAATSVCFDLSVFEIFAPLAWGGRLILAENALELPSLPARGEVRLLNTVPSAAAELVRSGGLPASVRTVNLAGEPLPGALAAALYATGTVERVLNLYGPSEDTTYSTGALVPRASDRPPAIGRPLPGTRAFVVDRFGHPVPALVPGELWLAGAGLARGYLGRPELTAERFAPDPFAVQPGERVYRTGDRVRFRSPSGPDTELEFLGRIDHQVKVRGFRIELGEIEAALRDQPEIEDCVCLVRDSTLVAYLVGIPDLIELRSRLSRRLPAYMVPSAFVVLPALPRTPNGKLDRKALPAPERGAHAAGEIVAPRTPAEEILAEVWKELLGVDQVSVEDSFFSLGGHSLLGTRVLARVRQTFGVEVPLRDLFEHPTLASLAALIDGRIAEGGATPALLASLGSRSGARTGPFPLSYTQERLWLVDRLNPGSPAYNLPAALRFAGELNVPALRESLAAVVRRHESLRTRFVVLEGQPAQVIDPPGDFRLPLIELSSLPPEEREAEGARLAAAEMLRPFDLERGPLVRSTLVRLSPGSHLLLSTLHHIVSDGWSMGIFARELSLLYAALSTGPSSKIGAALPPLPIQYGDFAVWQRRTVSGPVLEKQIDYWRKQLAGLDPVLDLPADRPRPPVRSERGDTHSFAVTPAALQNLEALRSREGTTLFTALLAAFFALLSRVTGRDDLVVGTPVAGRRQIETEGLIGFFVNTLVPRADLSGNPAFREHLARLHRTFLDAQDHQDVPFDRLVLELAPDRSLSYTPIFQVSFTLQNAPARPLVLPGLTVSAVEGSTRTSKFDLTLTMQAHGGDLAGALTYATDLFDGPTIERLAGHFERLLTAAAAHPETPVRELPLLAPAEEEQLLFRWNDTDRPIRTDRLLHELIQGWAAETPDAPAVELPGAESLTFAELGRRANRLARRLLAVGAGPETRVALCLERHPDLIVGVLAALQAGAAFVVIDPAQPTARLALVLRDAAPAAVLTREPAASRLPELDLPVLRLDRDSDSGEPDTPPGVAVDLDHPAYVIYTSGSTGVPKGVVIRHGAVLNLLAALEEAIYQGSRPGLRVSVNAPLYFDGAIKQIIQLAQGRTLCLVPEEVRPDAAALARFLAERRVDVLDGTPAQLEALVAQGWKSDGQPVPERVLVGGEAISPVLWERLGQLRETRFFNVYGPSECTVDTTAREIGPDAPRPVLGHPIANVRTYVMDVRGDLRTPQPAGVPGELCIGGAGLARGYLGRPDLTAERFVPDPFSGEPGARLYRTGDLARWLPEGELEFLGRIDHQVKVRGFRIELGEIEAALRQHPAVGACVVLARDDERGNRLLVAYVTADVTGASDSPPDPAVLRAFLGERLPAYMVPAAFVVLDALPLTRNGKVDRKALPAPDRAATGAQPGEPGPRDLLELELVRLWEEVLRVQPVGIRDDFFALGGHSLLAVQLTGRLRERLGREVPLAALLGHPTVEGLASLLRRPDPQGETALRREPRVELAPGSGRPLFLVHPIGGEVVAYVSLARHLAARTGRPVHGLQAPDPPGRTIEEMAAGYLRSVREVQPAGPYTLGGWSMGGVVAFEMARQLEQAGEEVDTVVLIDSFAPTIRRESLTDGALVVSFASDLAGSLGIDLTGIGLPPELLDLEAAEALERLAGLAERAGLLPPGLDAAELARRFAVFANGHRALERYAPGPGRAPLLLFRATERPAGMAPPPADLGWSPLAAAGPVSVHEQPGGHYTLLREPEVARLASQLCAHLETSEQTAEQTRLPLEISSVESPSPSMKGRS